MQDIFGQAMFKLFRHITVTHALERFVRLPLVGNDKRTGAFLAVVFEKAVNITGR